MSKLYFLVPNADLAARIVAELKLNGVSEEDIGLVANDQVALDDLPEPDLIDRSDIKPALKQGAAVGGATGLAAGVLAAVVPGGFVVGGAALAGMVLAGGAFGAWASSLIGVSVPNREIKEFERSIDQGGVLLILNTTEIGRDEAKRLVIHHHPEVEFGGEEGAVISAAS